jgi:hypothetical protein
MILFITCRVVWTLIGDRKQLDVWKVQLVGNQFTSYFSNNTCITAMTCTYEFSDSEMVILVPTVHTYGLYIKLI